MSSSSDIERLEQAIVSGHQRVQYKDRTVEYRSLDEMERTLARMKREAGLARSTRRRTNPTYDSGL